MSNKKANPSVVLLEGLTTKNKTVLDFYKKNVNIDFDQMNLLLVKLLEKVMVNITGELTHTITRDLVESIKIIGKDILVMKDTITQTNKDTLTSILLRLYEQKGEFINEIKFMTDKSLLKIMDKMEKEQYKLINEVIPKSNTDYYQKYEAMLKIFKDDIKSSQYDDTMDNKYNEMIKMVEISLLDNISKTENRIQTNMNEIKTLNIIAAENHKELSSTVTTHLNKYNNSTLKGQMAENKIEELLCSIYNSSTVTRTTKDSKTGDFILSRSDKQPIIFEVKDYSINVPNTEVDKFIRDINENKMNGVMLSLSSGISNKSNFQIDIINDNICIYINNVNYEIEKIRLAVDIIDNLEHKIKNNKNNITITSDIIEKINSEYVTFRSKRDMAIEYIKESTKKSIQYIEELELKTLCTYLNSIITFSNTSTLNCTVCNSFIGTNNKSLSAHKRKCKKPINSDDDPITKSDENIKNQPLEQNTKKNIHVNI